MTEGKPAMKRSLNPRETNSLLSYEYDRGSNYEGVLQLTAALEALIPEGDESHPDQRFFQATHLISEYAWAQIHYELRRVVSHLDAEECLQAARLVERSTKLSEIAVSSMRLLADELPQHSLLTMRNALPDDATGLDSPGYRNLRRVSREVWRAYEDAMKREGLGLDELIGLQNPTAGGHDNPRAQPLAILREALLRLDSSMLNWKHSHLIMVWSQLGGQPGLRSGELPQSLGGRSISTMETRADFTLFPQLWRAAEDMYWSYGTRHGGDEAGETGAAKCPVAN